MQWIFIRVDVRSINIVDDNDQIFKGVEITQEQAILFKQNTRDQALNEMWHNRSKRITSNFGRVMLRKCSVTQIFIDCKRKHSNLRQHAMTVQMRVATNLYRKKTGNHVHNCGLVVNPKFPCTAALPDGKVCDSVSTTNNEGTTMVATGYNSSRGRNNSIF